MDSGSIRHGRQFSLVSCHRFDFVRINWRTLRTSLGRMTMRLRSMVLACIWAIAFAAPQPGRADDDYPKRQIKIIVPFPGGAGPDNVARLLGRHLQEALGQPVVIENRAGALGSIGAQEVAHAA